MAIRSVNAFVNLGMVVCDGIHDVRQAPSDTLTHWIKEKPTVSHANAEIFVRECPRSGHDRPWIYTLRQKEYKFSKCNPGPQFIKPIFEKYHPAPRHR